jgi:RNA polymerase sigma-70 factor (ECF subfamily)
MAIVETGEVTRLLQGWSDGDKSALDALIPIVRAELRTLAAALLRRERTGHTLQATALVHEAYLSLVDQTGASCRSRSQFFAIAANLMRHILVDHARRHRSAKRGGGNKIPLEEVAGLLTYEEGEVDLLALDEALNQLTERDPRQGQIVELRFFGGLTENEIAALLGISVITVKRDWRMAKAVLRHFLSGGVLL